MLYAPALSLVPQLLPVPEVPFHVPRLGNVDWLAAGGGRIVPGIAPPEPLVQRLASRRDRGIGIGRRG